MTTHIVVIHMTIRLPLMLIATHMLQQRPTSRTPKTLRVPPLIHRRDDPPDNHAVTPLTKDTWAGVFDSRLCGGGGGG